MTRPEQADAVVAEIGQRFRSLDEGWSRSSQGYRDRKVLAAAPDGTIAEIQIAPDFMWHGKDCGGQALFTQSRALPPGPEQDALVAREIAIYSAATAGADPVWNRFGGITSGPNVGSNVARQTGSAMTPAVLATSSASTATQSSPGASTAKALSGESSTSEGRQSQLTKDGIATPEASLGAEPEVGKAVPGPAAAAGEASLETAVPSETARTAPTPRC